MGASKVLDRVYRAAIWAMIASAVVFLAVVLYIGIGNQIPGFVASSFGESGPHWPFVIGSVSFTAFWIFVLATLAIAGIRRVKQARSQRHSPA